MAIWEGGEGWGGRGQGCIQNFKFLRGGLSCFHHMRYSSMAQLECMHLLSHVHRDISRPPQVMHKAQKLLSWIQKWPLHEPDIIQHIRDGKFWQQWLSKTPQMPSCEFLLYTTKASALCALPRKVTVCVGQKVSGSACGGSDLAPPPRKILDPPLQYIHRFYLSFCIRNTMRYGLEILPKALHHCILWSPVSCHCKHCKLIL
jgi:hypothetical protein